jgi:polyisoprenoid-binding protein YceI
MTRVFAPLRHGLSRPRHALVAVVVLLAAAVAGPAAAEETWTVDAARSHLLVYAFAAGVLSPVLHDHHLAPERWSGVLAFDPERLAALRLVVTIAADSFRDRQPALSEDDRRTVEAQVRGPGILDTARHPEIVNRAERIEVHERSTDALRGTLHGLLTLRGRSRPLAVPVAAQWSADRLRATGRVTVRQTDHGIEPYRRFLGSVAIRDEIAVEFTVEAVRGR